MNATEFLAGGVWFLLYAGTVYVLVRAAPRRSPASIALAAACLFAVGSLPASALTPADGNYWRILAVFVFWTLCYLMAFGATYKSLSLRILWDLYQAPSRRLAMDAVFSRYIENESLEARLQAIVSQGFATASEGGFSLTPRGYRIAVAAQYLQRLYCIENSG